MWYIKQQMLNFSRKMTWICVITALEVFFPSLEEWNKLKTSSYCAVSSKVSCIKIFFFFKCRLVYFDPFVLRMQHYESCAQWFPSVLHLLFVFIMYSFHPCTKKNTVPCQILCLTVTGKRTTKFPLVEHNLDNPEFHFKTSLRCPNVIFPLGFLSSCQLDSCTSLFNAVSPLLPAVSHVGIVKHVFKLSI